MVVQSLYDTKHDSKNEDKQVQGNTIITPV